jgi:hypothetical protein
VTTPPPPPPPPPAPKSRRKLVLLLGCASLTFMLVLIGVAVLMFTMLRRERREFVALPGSWRDDLRAFAALPSEAELLRLPRTDSGDAAALLPARRGGPSRSATVMRIGRGMALDSTDRNRLAQATTDTTVDLALRAARMSSYRIVPRLLADTPRQNQFWGVPVPEIYTRGGVIHAANGLILRGYQRARTGRADAAREDLRGAISLGLLMHQREPTMAGASSGLNLVRTASRVLADVARRDTTTAEAARRLGAWAEQRSSAFSNLWRAVYANPDSARAAIADTTLPFGFRAEVLYLGTIGEVFRDAWRMFWGPSRDAYRTVRAYQSSPDPDLAALALAADSALRQIDRVGGFQRIRGMSRQR